MAQSNEILQAAKQICEEKNISLESVIETIEAALAVAFRKDFGEKNQNIKVEFDINTAQASVLDEKTVVTDEKAELTEKLKEEKKALEESQEDEAETDKPKKSEKRQAPLEKKVEANKKSAFRSGSECPSGSKTGGKEEKPASEAEGDEEIFDRFNPKTEITLTDAKKIKKGSKLDDVIRTELTPPAAYGRMAAQTAKQVIIQRLREAEREIIYNDFKDKEGEVINGTIQRLEGRMVLIDLGPTTALLPPSEQIPGEKYTSGQRFKFFVVAVSITPKGPEIILSRSHPDMVKKLFYLEVPEIGNGSVEIKSVAREAGARTKIAVLTNQKNIDPVGSCVGQRGSRVQTIISEIGGEKIDIIEWEEDSVKFITNALSPAKVLSVKTNDKEKTALAEVKEDQLSLAIGKAGQNVRLSAKLTGWKIDIVSDRGGKVSSADKKKTDDEDGKESAQGREAAEEDKDKPAEEAEEKQPEKNDDDVKELKTDVDEKNPSASSHSGPVFDSLSAMSSRPNGEVAQTRGEPSGPKAESSDKKDKDKEVKK